MVYLIVTLIIQVTAIITLIIAISSCSIIYIGWRL